jgi:uncharacterized SAM-binding protein YcdF (DUF218 family)
VLRRLAFVVIAAIVGANVLITASGYFVFNRAASSPLEKADAVVVLAGEHDGREEYGISLAQRGLASTVVLSNPYRGTDESMHRLCTARYHNIEVLCDRPPLTTTRGEAMMASELAAQRHWHRLIVVTWRFHLPRTRFTFGRCLPPGTTAAYVAVPRQYLYSLAVWELQYLYQYAALAKAAVVPPCR